MEFQTYEGLKGKKCGQCRVRMKVSGHCIKEHAYVKMTDEACKDFEDKQSRKQNN